MKKDTLRKKRLDHEPPAAVAERGWRYHHVGIPCAAPGPGEEYLAPWKLYKSGFAASPYGIEWMRFEPGCRLPKLVQTVPHVAFEVDDLDAALRGKTVIVKPGVPSAGVRAAMIVHNGAPVELIEFKRSKPGRKTRKRRRSGGFGTQVRE